MRLFLVQGGLLNRWWCLRLVFLMLPVLTCPLPGAAQNIIVYQPQWNHGWSTVDPFTGTTALFGSLATPSNATLAPGRWLGTEEINPGYLTREESGHIRLTVSSARQIMRRRYSVAVGKGIQSTVLVGGNFDTMPANDVAVVRQARARHIWHVFANPFLRPRRFRFKLGAGRDLPFRFLRSQGNDLPAVFRTAVKSRSGGLRRRSRVEFCLRRMCRSGRTRRIVFRTSKVLLEGPPVVIPARSRRKSRFILQVENGWIVADARGRIIAEVFTTDTPLSIVPVQKGENWQVATLFTDRVDVLGSGPDEQLTLESATAIEFEVPAEFAGSGRVPFTSKETPERTPVAFPTLKVTPTLVQDTTPTIVPSPLPTVGGTATVTPKPTASNTPMATFTVISPPTPTFTATATASIVLTLTPTPTPTATSTPTPTNTLTPTVTFTPTVTPTFTATPGTLIAYEPFDSAVFTQNNTIEGLASGQGFGSNVWTGHNDFISTSPGLAYANNGRILPTAGLRAEIVDGLVRSTEIQLDSVVNFSSSSSLYLSALMVFDPASLSYAGGNRAMLEIKNSDGHALFHVGRMFANTNIRVRPGGSGGNYMSNGIDVVGGQTYLVVVKIEWDTSIGGNETVSYWVDPEPGSTTEPTPADTAQINLVEGAEDVASIGIVLTNSGVSKDFMVDEIRVGTTWDVVVPGS